VARRQPEDVVEHSTISVFSLLKRGRAAGFDPRLAIIDRTKNRWPQVTGARGHHNGSLVARVLYQVMNYVTQKNRAGDSPLFPRLVSAQNEGALAGRNQ
jgi:hypothetical protein